MRRKPKLLVVLGAGSSVEFGIPGTVEIGKYLFNRAREWAQNNGRDDYFRVASEGIAISKSEWGGDAVPTTFETVLGLMPQLMHWASPISDPMRWLTRNEGLRVSWSGLDGYFDWALRNSIRDQYTILLAELGKCIKNHCTASKAERSIADYAAFMSTLRERFQISIFSLNYDDLADRAIPDLFNGFDRETGRFNARSVQIRSKWDDLYHLHGAIHFDFQGTDVDGRGAEITWNRDPNRATVAIYHEYEDPRFDLRAIPHGSIIAGDFKTDQILHEPFSSYFGALARRAYQADAILFCGYGFGDQHINRLIENRMKLAARSPPCVVLDYSPDDGDFMPERGGAWSRNLSRTLRTYDYEFIQSTRPAPGRPFRMANLKSENSFEMTDNGRVAIWHNGFASAFNQVDRICERLSVGPRKRVVGPRKRGKKGSGEKGGRVVFDE